VAGLWRSFRARSTPPSSITGTVLLLTSGNVHCNWPEFGMYWLVIDSWVTLQNNIAPKAEVGRAIAQAVSRWLPTKATRVRARVWSREILSWQSGGVEGFLRVLLFPLPILNPPIAPQSPSSIIWSWYNRPVLAAVPSRLSLTPLRITITEQWWKCAWAIWKDSKVISDCRVGLLFRGRIPRGNRTAGSHGTEVDALPLC
jgi:hypothetical protein